MTVPENETSDIRWVTLREAAEATSASLPALRRWYREGLIRAMTVPGMHGSQKLVDLDEVIGRAAASPNIGRRGPSRRAEQDAVVEALLDQVAAFATELDELRARVAQLEATSGQNTSPGSDI